jgi:hypothetical protein
MVLPVPLLDPVPCLVILLHSDFSFDHPGIFLGHVQSSSDFYCLPQSLVIFTEQLGILAIPP